MCEKWGLHESDTVRAMTGHCKLSDETKKLGLFRKFCEAQMMSLHGISAIVSVISGGGVAKLHTKFERHYGLKPQMACRIVCIDTEETMLMTVFGGCDVGDKVMLLPMYDVHERTLGIIVDDKTRRKGICLYPKSDTRYEYKPCEFQL